MLVAAGTAFANAASIYLDSSFDYYSNNEYKSSVSAWETVRGKGTTEVTAARFDGTTQQIVNAAGSAATNSLSALDKTVSLSGLYSGSSIDSSKNYTLNSYAWISRPNNQYKPTNLGLAVYNGSTLIGFSTNVSWATESSKYGSATFTNIYSYANGELTTTALVLDATTSYTFKIYSETPASTSTTATETIGEKSYYATTNDSDKVGYGEFQMWFSSGTGGKLDGMDNVGGDYKKPVVRLEVSEAIPEPSAFGLLAGLGALALVASRRRRSRK